MKKTFKLSLLITALLAIVILACSCGSSGPDISGKYLLTGCTSSIQGGEEFDAMFLFTDEENPNAYLNLEKGGKGSFSYLGFDYNLTYKLDGEKFEGTVKFLGIEEAMTGTYKDGVIDVVYGDNKCVFTLEK